MWKRSAKSKRGKHIWTAPAEASGAETGIIDLFAPENERDAEAPALFSDDTQAPDLFNDESPADGARLRLTAERAPKSAQPGTVGDIQGEEAIDASDLGLMTKEERERAKACAKKRTRGLALCFLGMLLIAFVLFAWLVFRVEDVRVTGNEHMTAEEVIQKAGIQTGTHMLALRAGACEEALRKDPYIATAAIKRQYPNIVNIAIKERVEAAVIVGMNAVAIVDAEGYVLSIGERDSYNGLVKVYGAGSSGYKVNGHVGDSADYTSRAMVRMIAAIQKSGLMDRIDSVDIANTLNVTLLTTAGVTVQLGQPEDLDNKLNTLSLIMPELISLGYTDGTVQITSQGDPVYSPPQSAVTEASEDEAGDEEYNYVPSDNGITEEGTEEKSTGGEADSAAKPDGAPDAA